MGRPETVAKRLIEAERLVRAGNLDKRWSDHSICGVCDCRRRPEFHARSEECHPSEAFR